MKIIKDNFIPELCFVILFDNSAIPITVFGLTGKIDPYLIAGFSQAVNSFINYISAYLPDIGDEKAQINNFLNSGFFYRKFRSKVDNKEYAFIFRPIYNKLFSSDWISKILNNIVKELENAEDIGKKAEELFQSFNATLFYEINIIEQIKEHEDRINRPVKPRLIFRESGIKFGNLNDEKLEEILDIIINNFEICSQCELNFDGNVYTITREVLNNDIVYYKLTTYTRTDNE